MTEEEEKTYAMLAVGMNKAIIDTQKTQNKILYIILGLLVILVIYFVTKN